MQMNGELLDSFPTNERIDELITEGAYDTQIVKTLRYLGTIKQHEFKAYVKKLASGYASKEAKVTRVRLRFIFTH